MSAVRSNFIHLKSVMMSQSKLFHQRTLRVRLSDSHFIHANVRSSFQKQIFIWRPQSFIAKAGREKCRSSQSFITIIWFKLRPRQAREGCQRYSRHDPPLRKRVTGFEVKYKMDKTFPFYIYPWLIKLNFPRSTQHCHEIGHLQDLDKG